MWIKKTQEPEWDYADVQDLMNVELLNAINKLKPGENAPFMLLDVRE
jgi:hypothetical protein